MANGTCIVEVCDNPKWARDWCSGHYIRWKKTGDPGTTPIAVRPPRDKSAPKRRAVNPKPCSVPTCPQDSRRYGLCPTHGERLIRWGDVREDLPTGRKPPKPCAEPSCPLGAKSRGMCSKHYAVLQRKEIKADPARLARWQETAQRCGPRWRVANKEQSRQYQRFYRMNNPLKSRADDRRRYAKFKAVLHIPFTYEQFVARMAYWGNRCWMCGGPFESVDHVKPINKGGPHILANTRPACRSCNPRKRDKWPFPTHVALHLIPLL